MKLLVSACLLGVGCRYDGKSNQLPQYKRLLKEHTCIPAVPPSAWAARSSRRTAGT